MHTPQFKLTQDDEYLYAHMFIPNAQLNKFQVFYINQILMCSCPPYYLRLLLPGNVKCWEEVVYGPKESYKAFEFDPNNFEMKIPMPKQNKGEDFGDLSDLERFLSIPKDEELLAQGIDCYFRQRLQQENDDDDDDDDDDADDEEDDDVKNAADSNDKDNKKANKKCTKKYPYGFNDSYSGILELYSPDDLSDIFDITSPETKSKTERTTERLEAENDNFDGNHYLADYFDLERLEDVLTSTPPWLSLIEQTDNILTESDHNRLDSIPKKEQALTQEHVKRNLLTVLDILFGYCYDMRTTDYEHTVESAWTIRKLSSCLSWLDTNFGEKIVTDELDVKLPKHDCCLYVMASCMRRSLIYPQFRNMQLAKLVYKDVCDALLIGKDILLKFFLDMHRIFEESSDNHSLYNTLFINDLCWFIKDNITEKHLKFLSFHLTKKMQDNCFKQEVFNFELDYLEMLAELEIKRQLKNAAASSHENDSDKDIDHDAGDDAEEEEDDEEEEEDDEDDGDGDNDGEIKVKAKQNNDKEQENGKKGSKSTKSKKNKNFIADLDLD